MFGVRSCSPALMKILVPVIAKVPSGFGSARVLSRARSEPQCGSVRHMVPVHSPDTMGLRNTSLCQSSATCLSASLAPCESRGYIPHDRLAESIISLTAAPRTSGMPWPPCSGSAVRPVQPPSQNCR